MTRTLFALTAILLLALPAASQAATYTLPGGTLPSGCSAAGNVVTCGSVRLGNNDTIVVTSPVTLNVSDFEMGNGASINADKAASQLTINSANDVEIGNNATVNATINAQDDVSIGTNGAFNGDITAGDSLTIRNNSSVEGVCSPTHPLCSGTSTNLVPIAEYRLDEPAWSGVAGEVADSSGNARHGSAINGAGTVEPGAICRAGHFDGSSHVQVSNLSSVLSGTASLSFWIRTTQTGDNTNWRAPGVSGVEQAGGTNDIFWGWLDASGRIGISKGNDNNARSTVAINNGQWRHVVLTRNASSGAYTIYIDGSLDRSGTTGSGQVTTPFSSIGRIENTNASRSAAYLVGDLDEVLVFDRVLDAGQVADIHAKQAAGKNLDGSERECPQALQCVSDGFGRSELGDDWSVTNRSGSFGNPRIVNGRLRLTNTSGNVATAATFQRLFPSANNRLVLEFDYYAYGGSGADGIAVTLSDASVTPSPGGYGGSLGYANRSGVAGFAGGWLGMGLDSFGNFSNATEGRSGGPGRILNSIALRGSGSGQSGYRYIDGTSTLSPTVRNNVGHRYRVTVDSQVAGQSWVTIERDSGSGFQTLIGPVDVLSSAGQAAVPENLLLTLTGSTGGSNDNHEIDNLEVCALRMEPLEPQVHHFRILHDGAGLTCAPETVTIQACANNDCSTPYTGSVDLSLQPANSGGQYWLGGSNAKSFSGGSADFQLRRNSTGTATLGIASATPGAANVTRCFRNGVEGNCSLSFADSGLVFDVPTLIAGKPADVVISARRTDPANPDSCAPGMTGTRTVGFHSTYDDPGSGSARVHVDGNAVSNGSGWTNLPLEFDGNADATVSVRYDDAGLMSLYARYQGTAANEDAGLTLNGSDGFVVKPAGLCVESPAPAAACAAADHTCSAFVAAGTDFDLEVRAVAWQSDADADLCTGNPTTPNYRQSGLALDATLVAPAAGSPGSVGTATMALGAADAGERTVAQSISEVGVFRFTATPPAGAYFGETVAGGESAPLGRFIPARLAVSGNTPQLDHACADGGFSYLGQPFGFLVDPQITVTGLNAAGGVTSNYGGPFWRLASSLAGRSHENAVAGTAATLGVDAAGTVGWAGTGDYDGAGQATLTGVQLNYGKPLDPEAPFDARVHLDLTAADLTDGDGACHDPDADGSCEGFRLADIGGTQLRWGRLAVERRHQHLETEGVTLPLRAEQFDGSRFVLNADDSCSALTDNEHVHLNNNSVEEPQTDGNIAIGEGSTNLSGLGSFTAGLLQLQFSAPKPNPGAPGKYDGFVDITPRLEAAGLRWLRYDWNGDGAHDDDPRGRASWGLYRGNPAVIRTREIWR